MDENTLMEESALPIGAEQLRGFMGVLNRYKAGRQGTESRIIASENWWKLRNTLEEQKESQVGFDGGFTSRSAWLHNVIVSKHADMMDAYPAPVILPREQADKEEAQRLSQIIPCVLERNHFEDTYSAAAWQKGKTGTGVYKVVWDSAALNGLGDIAVSNVNLLNLYWEPGRQDIQDSRYLFHTQLEEEEALLERYPQLEGKLKGNAFVSSKFLYDDTVDTANKHTVIEVYYKKAGVLHYCKFVGDQVLFATENLPEFRERGLYDHGLYPYVFDALFPIEGSPCGYGYVDVCRNPQAAIDILKTAYIKNAMVGATPRYFSRGEGAVNEEEFLDLSQPLVHTAGTVSDDSLKRIDHTGLDGVYMNVLTATIEELRETSGNTETATGNISGGVTAASAIAALQEASGKGSRDASYASYRAYGRVVELCIALIRQFYDLPRQFRITGTLGEESFVSYTNAGLQPKYQTDGFGRDMGWRLPVFDIRVSAQKKSRYASLSQNELALQLWSAGFFDPSRVDQALQCLDMMDFDGKEALMGKLQRGAGLRQKLEGYMRLCLSLSGDPRLSEQIARDLAQLGGSVSGPGGTPTLAFTHPEQGAMPYEGGAV